MPIDELEWLLDQFRARYLDFTAKHFHEALRADKPAFALEQLSRGREVLAAWSQDYNRDRAP